jgi:hypothetical protein
MDLDETTRDHAGITGILVIAGLAGSLWQSELIGWWRGEAKYKGRYTNSWRAEL